MNPLNWSLWKRDVDENNVTYLINNCKLFSFLFGFKAEKTQYDVATILSASQRYLFTFGITDFGLRPTIVPVKTLDCIEGGSGQPQKMEKCTNPDAETESNSDEETESSCEVPLRSWNHRKKESVEKCRLSV